MKDEIGNLYLWWDHDSE